MRELSWETVGLLALFVAIGAAMFLVFYVLTLRAVAWMVRKDVARLTAGRRVVRRSLTANYFGQESRGRAQIRGNGALVLTEQNLIFVLAAPRRELVIPLAEVTGTALTRRHLGKTIIRRLLRVDWRGAEGPDAVAWAVARPELWVRDIERLRRR